MKKIYCIIFRNFIKFNTNFITGISDVLGEFRFQIGNLLALISLENKTFLTSRQKIMYFCCIEWTEMNRKMMNFFIV